MTKHVMGSIAASLLLGVSALGCGGADQARSTSSAVWSQDGGSSSDGGCSEGGSGCTLTQGYWKNHGGWPVSSLVLGTVTYTEAELRAIFGQPVQGNGLISLAHQLIAAKLNIAAGADPSALGGAIAAADALIGGLVVPPVGSGYLKPSVASSLVGTLDAFNSGDIGPGHCGSTPTIEPCNPSPPPAPCCGDGHLDFGEECDDGNLVNGDGCSATCLCEPVD